MSGEWKFRQEICEIGRRLYGKGFAAGNEGNISCRLSQNEVLCTPTQICKGYMKEDDLCVVDLDGNQLRGKRPRTSEILLHLEIMKGDPEVKSVVHCHPPHPTAFAIARIDIPTCILPEIELFVGVTPRAEYETPGSEHFAATIRPFIGKANTCLLSNHGTVSWGPSVERAFWYTEIINSYCQTLLLAKQLGEINRLSHQQVDALLDLRANFGTGEDPRRTFGGEMCINPSFGSQQDVHSAPDAGSQNTTSEADPSLVSMITEEVLKALKNGR